MRKIRAAAAVAAMVAGLGTLGAGTAFAGGQPPVFNQANTAACDQEATQNNNALVGDLNLLSGLAVGVLGQAETDFSSGESVANACEIGQKNDI